MSIFVWASVSFIHTSSFYKKIIWVFTILKVLFFAMGNSLMTHLFLFLFGDTIWSAKIGTSLLHEHPSTDIYRIKLLPYFAHAVLVSLLILLLQYAVHKKHKTFAEMVEKKHSIFYLIVCAIGYDSLASWLGQEMELRPWMLELDPQTVLLSALILYYEIAFFFRFKNCKA